MRREAHQSSYVRKSKLLVAQTLFALAVVFTLPG
jgi:hypothetical protein